MKNKIEEYEKTVYDFLNDFSSSDYETVDEEELKKEEEREYSRNFKQSLIPDQFEENMSYSEIRV